MPDPEALPLRGASGMLFLTGFQTGGTAVADARTLEHGMSLASIAFDVDFTIDGSSKSRRAALWNLAGRVGALRPQASKNEVARCLYGREKLGTTAIGAGVAVPHAALEERCPPLILATRLREKLDFHAPDGLAVDTLLGVVGDRGDLRWLQAVMPRVARLVRDGALMDDLRSARDADGIRRILARIGLATTG